MSCIAWLTFLTAQEVRKMFWRFGWFGYFAKLDGNSITYGRYIYTSIYFLYGL